MKHLLLGMIAGAFMSLASSRPTHVAEGVPFAKRCDSEVGRYNVARRQERGTLTKRTFYPGLQNLTCIAAPETPLLNYVANRPFDRM
ncbi:hypothetical protein BDQ17DRAFT_64760 [Cyathus striatus]|nr:hypothetical protein BDQ17DRAFT_64760 [Cyathus striatus]